jgi:hypothetical protein
MDLPKRTIIVRRLKGSTDGPHYLERDEHKALGDLRRAYAAKGIKSDYVFVNERGEPFGRMGIARKIEHAGEAAGLPFPIHVHMLRHSTGYAAARGMDTRRLQHFLGHASITNTVRYTAMSPEPLSEPCSIARLPGQATLGSRPADEPASGPARARPCARADGRPGVQPSAPKDQRERPPGAERGPGLPSGGVEI